MTWSAAHVSKGLVETVGHRACVCMWQKRPVIWQKRPVVWQKRPAVCVGVQEVEVQIAICFVWHTLNYPFSIVE